MAIYKITFANNTIVIVNEVAGHYEGGDSFFYESDGKLVFAFVKADSTTEAYSKGHEIVISFLENGSSSVPTGI